MLYEIRKFFGARSSERLAPSVALFELAYARFAEREARQEAVHTLEDVTHRVHSEYARKLSLLEVKLFEAAGAQGGADPERLVALERDIANALLLAPTGTRTLAMRFWSLSSELDYAAAATPGAPRRSRGR